MKSKINGLKTMLEAMLARFLNQNKNDSGLMHQDDQDDKYMFDLSSPNKKYPKSHEIELVVQLLELI